MSRPRLAPALAVAIAVGALVVSILWGRALRDDDRRITVNAAPFLGQWKFVWSPWMLLSVATSIAVVALWPAIWRRASSASLPWWATAVSALWGIALGCARGAGELARPLGRSFEYLAAVPLVGDDPVGFLDRFVRDIESMPVHVEAHPPGLVLVLWAMGRIGIGGIVGTTALTLTLALSTPAAVLMTVRRVAGEEWMRRAAPLIVFVPSMVFVVTSTDAMFMGIAAWMTWLGVEAQSRRSDVLAVAAGLVGGILLAFAYSAPLYALPLAFVLLAGRSWRALVVIAVSAAVPSLVMALGGFWLLDGLNATRERYGETVARFRPYRYFVLANLAVLAVGVGPVVVAGLARLREKAIWVLVGGGLAGVMIANLSGLSKAETERIWLPFVPWIALAGAAMVTDRAARIVVGVNVAIALGVGLYLITPW
jgi:methylthioxylose transferase